MYNVTPCTWLNALSLRVVSLSKVEASAAPV